ncbi:hypothetical protein [Yersinia intermedia]|uniref:hypothetical protein n=1 Tax=Yersinia intermedia TaxID=631 RepID=UPI00065DAA48|nr:hypothetical protein [Yersinia intermedia]CRY75338.1 Uncharacterised protein [Yersinia intermedia]
MFSIAAIIELLKTGFGFFQKKEQNKDELNSQNYHEQNQITLEETRNGKSWRQAFDINCVLQFYSDTILSSMWHSIATSTIR